MKRKKKEYWKINKEIVMGNKVKRKEMLMGKYKKKKKGRKVLWKRKKNERNRRKERHIGKKE